MIDQSAGFFLMELQCKILRSGGGRIIYLQDFHYLSLKQHLEEGQTM